MMCRYWAIAFASWLACGTVEYAVAQAPRPAWAQLVDLGETEPSLKGIRAPRGIKVEVSAEGAVVGQPLAIAFGDNGTILVLQGKTLAAPEQLVSLGDSDGDGKFEKSEVVMSDLAGRTSLLFNDGWYYLAGNGTVIRRHAHEPKLAAELQASAAAKKGPPTIVTADKKWLEQTLIRGLIAKPADQTGGLTPGLDSSIYLSSGGIANRVESWDGSKATVLGSGAIFRFRSDGSKVQEFARGCATPMGAPTRDGVGNVFQAGRIAMGSRILHVLEGADYGWRADIDPPKLDRPGTLPAMLQSSSLAPDSTLVYSGTAFPKLFQGLLLLAKAKAGIVQSLVLEPAGNSFSVRQQFELMRGDPAHFAPRIVALGPEGAIYLVDTRPAGARMLRLIWSGTKETPAIDTPVLSAFKPTQAAAHADLLTFAQEKSRPAAERAAALGRACHQWDKRVLDVCLALLVDDDADLARLAADAIGDHLPDDAETQKQIFETAQQKILAGPLPVRRSLYIAIGKLGTQLDSVPEWIFEATSVTPDVHTNPYLFEAHARAAEMPAGWATELMLGNLEVALFDANPEPEERVRLKKFVVATAEQMRTRELGNFLDKSIRDEKDYFSKLDAPLQARLLAAYQNVLVEPAITADAVALWLAKHPAAANEVQQAAWNTLAKVGASKPELVIAPAKAIVAAGKTDPSLKPSVLAALARHCDPAKRGEIDEVMDSLSRVANKSP